MPESNRSAFHAVLGIALAAVFAVLALVATPAPAQTGTTKQKPSLKVLQKMQTSRPAPPQTCTASNRDGDGHACIAQGGDDCDDSDPRKNPWSGSCP